MKHYAIAGFALLISTAGLADHEGVAAVEFSLGRSGQLRGELILSGAAAEEIYLRLTVPEVPLQRELSPVPTFQKVGQSITCSRAVMTRPIPLEQPVIGEIQPRSPEGFRPGFTPGVMQPMPGFDHHREGGFHHRPHPQFYQVYQCRGKVGLDGSVTNFHRM